MQSEGVKRLFEIFMINTTGDTRLNMRYCNYETLDMGRKILLNLLLNLTRGQVKVN